MTFAINTWAMEAYMDAPRDQVMRDAREATVSGRLEIVGESFKRDYDEMEKTCGIPVFLGCCICCPRKALCCACITGYVVLGDQRTKEMACIKEARRYDNKY